MAQGKAFITEIDFGELAKSEKFTAAIIKLNKNLDGTKAQLEALAKCDVEKLSLKDQVMLDLYLAYTVNSLYWMYLRTKGINPATHAIKSEINRVRECVGRANRICNRKQPTTRLDKEAAKRFIRSGLWKAGETPAGGVVKKFNSTNAEVETASSSNNINNRGAEARQFKVPHANMKLVIEKFGSTNIEVKASSSSSNLNDKGAEANQFTPHANMERVTENFDRISVGEVKPSSSFNKANKKGGGKKQFKTPMKNPDGSYKTFEYTNAASSSFGKGNKKGGGIKQFKSPNGKPEGGFQKFDSWNAGAGQVPSSFSQVNKKGGETKRFKSPKGNAAFNKFDSTNVGPSPSFSQGNKKGGETKRFKSPKGKKGKKLNHNPHQNKKDEKLNYLDPQKKKDNKTIFLDSD